MLRAIFAGCVLGGAALASQDPLLRREGFMRQTNCGQDGRFEFQAVRPGEYFGFAIGGSSPTAWYQAMRDEEVLKQAGKVTVRAGESTGAEIRLVTR